MYKAFLTAATTALIGMAGTATAVPLSWTFTANGVTDSFSQQGTAVFTWADVNNPNSFTLTLTDNTQGWAHTTNARLKNARLGSAEVIAEAPSSSGGVLPLADFGTASFTGASANGVSFASQHPDAIDMVSGSTTKASTSGISGSGDFAVSWQHS